MFTHEPEAESTSFAGDLAQRSALFRGAVIHCLSLADVVTMVTRAGYPTRGSVNTCIGFRAFSLSGLVIGRWDSCCDGLLLVNPTAGRWWPWWKAWSPG